MDIEHENSNRFEEYEWCGQKRIRATTLLEGGFRGTSSGHVGSGQASAGYPSVGGREARAGGWSSAPPRGDCCWRGSFVTGCLPVMCILKWMYLGGEMEL